MLTEIYLHVDDIKNTCIDMFICDTEDQPPLWFRYKPSGKKEMVIKISYDGGKKFTFPKISRWQKFCKFVGKYWRPVCSFLKDILPPILAFVLALVKLFVKV